MSFEARYPGTEPSRAEIDSFAGPVVLEFGAEWCGFCAAAQPAIEAAFAGHPSVRHLKIADGRGLRLGRSYGVKLWPTLVFLHDGNEVDRLVRPSDADAVATSLSRIDR